MSLQECGAKTGSRLVTVRKVLYAEGWKIAPDANDVDSSDEEEEF